MSRRFASARRLAWSFAAAAAGVLVLPSFARAQQAIDQEYTKKIKEYLQDPRITTELVDHLPYSGTVPTPLRCLGGGGAGRAPPRSSGSSTPSPGPTPWRARRSSARKGVGPGE